MIVDLKKPKGRVDEAYSYVALSRVRRLTDVLILRPFDIKMLLHKLNMQIIIELDRLRKIEVETISVQKV